MKKALNLPAEVVVECVHSINSDRDYIHAIFHTYWRTHRIDEPTRYFSMREAIHQLCEGSGMTQAQVAARLEYTTNRLGITVARGHGFSIRQYEMLIHLAKTYGLPRLADYFDTQLSYAATKVGSKRGPKPTGMAGDNERSPWMDMMGEG